MKSFHEVTVLLDACTEIFKNPFAISVENSNKDTQSPHQDQENRDLLPNFRTEGQQNNSGTKTGESTTGSGTGARDPMDTFGMQSFAVQMMENSSLMRNMLSASYARSRLAAMTADPAMASKVISANPFLRDNRQMQEQMTAMMSAPIQLMQNPQIQSIATNPDALAAVMQIQRCMEQLQLLGR